MGLKPEDITEWTAAIKAWAEAIKALFELLKELFPGDTKTQVALAKKVIGVDIA